MGSNNSSYTTGSNIEYHLLPYKAPQTLLVRHLLAHIKDLRLLLLLITSTFYVLLKMHCPQLAFVRKKKLNQKLLRCKLVD